MGRDCIPRLMLSNNGRCARVLHWGVVNGLILTPGDELVLGAHRDGELLVLAPRGYGAPMLGRSIAGALLGEPGGVHASPKRWQSMGAVISIDRPLPTAPPNSFALLGTGQWCPSPSSVAIFDRPAHGGPQRWNWLFSAQQLQQCARHPARWSHALEVGLVFGRSPAAALSVLSRPGWVRYVLTPSEAVSPADVVSIVSPKVNCLRTAS